MSFPDPVHDRRQRRRLVALALLFFAPVALAFYLYYGPSAWRPGGHVNHGELIDPPRPLPELSLPLAARSDSAAKSAPTLLQGKWTLLYVGGGSCTAACRMNLYNMRQVRFALNRDMDRVQRVFLAAGDCCDWPFLETQHPDLITLRAGQEAEPWIALLPRVGRVDPLAAERIYFVDPLGNLMMFFAADAKPKGMLTDLKRLLGLSHVG